MQLKPETAQRIEWTLTRYPNRRAALLPILHLLQADQGSITDECVFEAAKICEVSPAWVYGVLSFYTLFKRPWEGRTTVWVCSTIACALNGSDRLYDYLKEALRCGPDGVSADGRYTLKKQECLAA